EEREPRVEVVVERVHLAAEPVLGGGELDLVAREQLGVGGELLHPAQLGVGPSCGVELLHSEHLLEREGLGDRGRHRGVLGEGHACDGLGNWLRRAHRRATPYPPTSTLPAATILPLGASAGSLHVMAGSPRRAAGLSLISTFWLPDCTVAWFDGGF